MTKVFAVKILLLPSSLLFPGASKRLLQHLAWQQSPCVNAKMWRLRKVQWNCNAARKTLFKCNKCINARSIFPPPASGLHLQTLATQPLSSSLVYFRMRVFALNMRCTVVGLSTPGFLSYGCTKWQLTGNNILANISTVTKKHFTLIALQF